MEICNNSKRINSIFLFDKLKTVSDRVMVQTLSSRNESGRQERNSDKLDSLPVFNQLWDRATAY